VYLLASQQLEQPWLSWCGSMVTRNRLLVHQQAYARSATHATSVNTRKRTRKYECMSTSPPVPAFRHAALLCVQPAAEDGSCCILPGCCSSLLLLPVACTRRAAELCCVRGALKYSPHVQLGLHSACLCPRSSTAPQVGPPAATCRHKRPLKEQSSVIVQAICSSCLNPCLAHSSADH
jgi:hypothetical protein